jgi:hypothetical protein
MRMRLTLRPDYGSISPWIDRAPDGAQVVAGPDAFRLSTPRDVRIDSGEIVAEFDAIEGARDRFVLLWHPSHRPAPPVEDANSALARTAAWWRAWSDRCTYDGPYEGPRCAELSSTIARSHRRSGQ